MRIRILDPGYKRFFTIFQIIFFLFDIFMLKDEPLRDKDIFDNLSSFQQFRFGLKAKDFCLQFLIGAWICIFWRILMILVFLCFPLFGLVSFLFATVALKSFFYE